MNKQENLDHLKSCIVDHYLRWYATDRKDDGNLFPSQKDCIEAIYKYICLNHSQESDPITLLNTLKSRYSKIKADGAMSWSKALTKQLEDKSINLNFDIPLDNLLEIIKQGNKIGHSGIQPKIDKNRSKFLNKQFQRFVKNYFEKVLKLENWYDVYVTPYVEKKAYQAHETYDSGNAVHKTAKLIYQNIVLINEEYWQRIIQNCVAKKEYIYKELLTKSDSRFAREYIALEHIEDADLLNEIYTREYKFILNNNESTAQPSTTLHSIITTFSGISILKIFATSGEGKTILLTKISKYLSSKTKEVYYIKRCDTRTLSQLQEIVNGNDAPIYFLLDTPSDYEEILNTISDIEESCLVKDILFIICDQEARYNNTLKEYRNSFDSFFDTHYTLRYHNSANTIKYVYDRLIAIHEISQSDKENYESIFLNEHTSLGEKVEYFSKKIAYEFPNKIEFDWDVFDSITDKPEYKEYKSLYPILASFTSFKDLRNGVPIEFIRKYFFSHINIIQFTKFINDQCTSLVIYENNNLKLRNEHKAIYFINHKPINKTYFNQILEQFARILELNIEPDTCYILRNSCKEILQSENYNNLYQQKFISFFELYLTKYGGTIGESQSIGKVFNTLLSIKKHEPLEEQIRIARLMDESENRLSVYAKTKLTHLYILNEDYVNANKYLQEAITIDPLNPYVLSLEIKFCHKTNQPATYLNRVKLSGEIKQEVLEVILNDRHNFTETTMAFLSDIGFEKFNKRASINYINFLVREGKFEESKKFFDRAKLFEDKNIYNILLHCQILFELNDFEAIEALLDESITLLPDYASLYILRLKLYRKIINDSNQKEIIEKQKKCFEELNRFQTDSPQRNTEYAKFILHNYSDLHSHTTAKELLEFNILTYTDNLHSTTELALLYQTSPHFLDVPKSIKLIEDYIQKYRSGKNERMLVATRVVLANSYLLIDTIESTKKAQEILESVENEDANNESTYYALLITYGRLNNTEGIGRVLNYVQKRGDTFVSQKIFTEISKYFFKSKKYNEALEFLESITWKIENEILLNIASNAILGIWYKHLHDQNEPGKYSELLQKGISYLNKSYDLNPENPYTIRNLIFIYDKYTEGPDSADKRNEFIKIFIKKYPQNIYVYQILTLIYRNKNKIINKLLDWNIKYEQLEKNEEKLKYLVIKKLIYKKMNYKNGIDQLDILVQELRTKMGEQASSSFLEYTNIDFAEREFEPLDRKHLCVSGFCQINSKGKIVIVRDNVEYLPTDKNSFYEEFINKKVYITIGYGISGTKVFRPEKHVHERFIANSLIEELPKDLNLLSW